MVGKVLCTICCILLLLLLLLRLNVGIGNCGGRSSLVIVFVFKLLKSVKSKPSAFVVDWKLKLWVVCTRWPGFGGNGKWTIFSSISAFFMMLSWFWHFLLISGETPDRDGCIPASIFTRRPISPRTQVKPTDQTCLHFSIDHPTAGCAIIFTWHSLLLVFWCDCRLCWCHPPTCPTFSPWIPVGILQSD